MPLVTYEDPRDLNDPEVSNTITSAHFGINFVANYERIGDNPWERFDEIVSTLQPGTIRYPGGILAEQGFDITDPNASEILLSDGSTQKTIGAFDFAEFAVAQGVRPTFIVPTVQLLVQDPDNPNKLVFDSNMESYLIDFVENLLTSAEGKVATFEIGNEYESYMDSAEYGLLVNQLAPMIQSVIDKYKSDNNLGSNWQEPKIAIQVWSWIAQDHSSMSSSDLVARANTEFSQLSSAALNAIDALTTHWYARDRSGGYSAAYHDLERAIESSISVLGTWSGFSSKPIELIVSEWAANFKEESFFGLAQVPIGVKMFAEFVQTGVDELNFWSTQYHGTSLALPNGELTAMGVVANYLQANVIGSSVFDLDAGGYDVGGVSFVFDDSSTILLSNLTDTTLSYDFLLSAQEGYYKIVAIGEVGVDTQQADGLYRHYSGLEYYNEPDLAGLIDWSQIEGNSWEETSVELNPFETVILKLEKIPVITGTDADNIIDGLSGARVFEAGGGNDFVSYENAQEGVSVYLDGRGVNANQATGHIYKSVEGIIGSGFDDILNGDGADNWFYGGAGNDQIYTFSGNDIVETGAGIDVVNTSWGDDTIHLNGDGGDIYAGADNDILYYSGGNYNLYGGIGTDTLSFENLEDRVQVWFNTGQIENSVINQGTSSFEGIEKFIGSEFDDRFTIWSGSADVNLRGGSDNITVGIDAVGSYHLGDGEDFVTSYAHGAKLNGGEGNDVIFSYGSNEIVGGKGDDLIVALGEDTIVFDLDGGNDTISCFSIYQDTLRLGVHAYSELQRGNYDIYSENLSAVLNFQNGGSILFKYMYVDMVEHLVDEFLL